jgi:glycosyltransferase involved in cell wall biosynthesis
LKSIAVIVFNTYRNDNRVYRTARTLQEEGYEVVVGALYEEGLAREEIDRGLKVERYEMKSRRLPTGRLFGFIKFAEMYLRFIFKYRKFDAIHANDFNPFFLGIIAKWITPGLKVVYDSHEYQSERFDKPEWRRNLIRKTEKKFARKADKVITVGRCIAQEYERLFDLKDVEVIYNVPDVIEVDRSTLLRDVFDLGPEKRVFLYQGGLVRSRGIETLMKAFSTLDDAHAVLVIMGSGALLPLVEEYAEKCDKIFFLPAVPYEELLNYTASADVGVVSTQNLCLNNYLCMPNKLFEYIQAGLPILSNNLKECGSFVVDRQLGFMAEEWEPLSVQETIAKFDDDNLPRFKSNSMQVAGEFNWQVEKEKLKKIYSDLLQ